MPGPQRRKKMHHGDTHLKKRWRLSNRTKDLDQIDEDLAPKQAEKLLNQELDLEKPGFAQFYCVHCARHFIDQTALDDHFRTKVHKRRMKALEDEPYSVAESERAGGLGSYIPPKKRRMETMRREGEVTLPQPVTEEETPEQPATSAQTKSENTEAGATPAAPAGRAMPRGRGGGWGIPRPPWKGTPRAISPGPHLTGPVPVLIVSAPSWHSAAPAAGTSVIILPALQGSARDGPSIESTPLPVIDLDVTPPSTPPSDAGDMETQPRGEPVQIKVHAPDASSLLTPTGSGRDSRLSTITVSAPVRCVCAFVADRVGRHCADCRRRHQCPFAAAKTLGYCGMPTLVLAWGVIWVIVMLVLGGVLVAPALGGS